LDLAKNAFQAHVVNASGNVLFGKKLRRGQVLEFFSAQPGCTVAMDACASAQYWTREIGKFGHTVRLTSFIAYSRIAFSQISSALACWRPIDLLCPC
jgi:transposase